MNNNNFFDIDDGVNIIEDDYVEEKIDKRKVKKKNMSNSKGLFDHLKMITENEYDKTYYDNLSESDRKTLSIYMINRYLSMNMEWLPYVNFFQQYNQQISGRELYAFYSSLLPNGRKYLKYVKGKIEKKYNPELITMICDYFQVSTNEAFDYLLVFNRHPNGKEELKDLCMKYGYTEKEADKIVK